MTTLNDLPIGKTATVAAVGGEGSLRQHFLDMGIIPLVDVTMVKHAPMGDPLEVRIHSYELTLRRDDARKIEIVDMRDAADAQESRPASPSRIPASARAASSTTGRARTRCRRARRSPSRSWATRTAARPRCSTS